MSSVGAAMVASPLALVTLNGQPLALLIGPTHEYIVTDYCRRHRLSVPTKVEYYKAPYFAGYQAIGGYSPKADEAWQLADGRLIVVVATDRAESRLRAVEVSRNRSCTLSFIDLDRAVAVPAVGKEGIR